MARRRAVLLGFAAAVAAPRRPGAQTPGWPDRPIRLVVPFAPGGTNDIVGRLVTEGMAQRLGQPFVIENRGGAGGMLGADLVAKAAPDGTTLLLASSGSLTISSLVHPRTPFDATTAFAPVGLIGLGPQAIVVHPALPVRTLADLQRVAWAAQPPLTYASAGVGSSGHAAGAMVLQALGVEMEHVPYRGTAQVMTDLIAGRVQMTVNALAPLLPHIRSGAARAVAIAGRERSAAMPDLPTTAEQGFPGIEAVNWFGLLAPAGTPPERIVALHAALAATLAEPAVQRRLLEGGVEVAARTDPAAFARFIAEDRARWQQVVRAAGMRGGAE